MFRFFCSQCKCVKRVQHIPIIIDNQSDDNPTNRIGICDYHSKPKQVKIIKSNKVEPSSIPISVNKMNKKHGGR